MIGLQWRYRCDDKKGQSDSEGHGKKGTKKGKLEVLAPDIIGKWYTRKQVANSDGIVKPPTPFEGYA